MSKICSVLRCKLPRRSDSIYCIHHYKKRKLRERSIVTIKRNLSEKGLNSNLCIFPNCKNRSYHNNICKKHLKFFINFCKSTMIYQEPDMKKIKLNRFIKFLFHASSIESGIKEIGYHQQELLKIKDRFPIPLECMLDVDSKPLMEEVTEYNSINSVPAGDIEQESLEIDLESFEEYWKAFIQNIHGELFRNTKILPIKR